MLAGFGEPGGAPVTSKRPYGALPDSVAS